MAHAPHVQVRRVYDPPEASDGQRVLVDRLWPRGLSKERAHLDEWCKDVAPSTGLRQCTATTPAGSRSSPAATAPNSTNRNAPPPTPSYVSWPPMAR
jgi:hypothetical protein